MQYHDFLISIPYDDADLPSGSALSAAEAALMKQIEQELRLQRRCAIFIAPDAPVGSPEPYTRLTTILSSCLQDIARPDYLHPLTSFPAHRNDWIAQKTRSGCNVLVTSTAIVQTGLNLDHFETLFIYQIPPDHKYLQITVTRFFRLGRPFRGYYIEPQPRLFAN